MNRNHALLALRLVVAAIFVWHGYPKILSPDGSIAFFSGLGIPGWLSPIVGWVEVLAGATLASGFMHRWAVAPLLVIILGALVLVQIPNGMQSGLERDVLITVSLVLLMMESRLAYSVGGRPKSE